MLSASLTDTELSRSSGRNAITSSPAKVIGSFADVNQKITATTDITETAAVKVKADTKVADNEDDAVKNVIGETEKSTTGND